MSFDFSTSALYQHNTAPQLNVPAYTIAFHICLDSATGTQAVWSAADAINPGTSVWGVRTDASGAGYKVSLFHQRATAIGQWQDTAVRSLATWYKYCISYDSGDAANDPLFFVDNAAAAISEIATPAGAANSGQDSWIVGRNPNLAASLDGKLAELGVWSVMFGGGRGLAAANGYSPLFRRRELILYAPMVREAVELVHGQPLSTSGTVGVAAHSPVRYPHRHGTTAGRRRRAPWHLFQMAG